LAAGDLLCRAPTQGNYGKPERRRYQHLDAPRDGNRPVHEIKLCAAVDRAAEEPVVEPPAQGSDRVEIAQLQDLKACVREQGPKVRPGVASIVSIQAVIRAVESEMRGHEKAEMAAGGEDPLQALQRRKVVAHVLEDIDADDGVGRELTQSSLRRCVPEIAKCEPYFGAIREALPRVVEDFVVHVHAQDRFPRTNEIQNAAHAATDFE